MNFLCQKQTSIVTDIPGTTRDVIEKHLDIGGYPVLLLDTAGLRNYTTDRVETQGIDRARSELTESDLTVILIAFSSDLVQDFKHHLHTYVNQVLDLNLDMDKVLVTKSPPPRDTSHLVDKRYLFVINKLDVATPEFQTELYGQIEAYDNVMAVSCTVGTHMEDLIQCMQSQLTMLCGHLSTPSVSFTQSRHAHHLQSTSDHLLLYLSLYSTGRGLDLSLAAQHLRLAARELGAITGEVCVEEVLDVIFSRFCIGK